MKKIFNRFYKNYIKNNLKSCVITTIEDNNYNDKIDNLYKPSSNVKIYYEGQNCNRDDKHLKKNSIYFYRKKKTDVLKFGGVITNIKTVREFIKNVQPALYELEINTKIKINNIKVNTPLFKNNNFSGPGCLKKSALYKLGYDMHGNNSSGINPIKKIDIVNR